jgi:hypothetical protein
LERLSKITANEQGFVQVGKKHSVCLEPLLIENILLKLRTNDQRCLSSPNQSLALQLADVKFVKPNLHKTQCWLQQSYFNL